MRIITISLILMVGNLMAQPESGSGFGPQNMDAVRIWKLTEVLELTEEQTVSFLPLVQIHERKLRDAQKELMQVGKTARKLSAEKELSQKDADKILKDYMSKHAEMAKIKQDFIKSLPKYLTPEQQIQYLGFEARFREELRDYMKDRRGQSGQPRRGKRM